MALTLGIDLGGTKIVAAVVDEGGILRQRVEVRTPVEEGGETVMRAAVQAAKEAVRRGEFSKKQIAAVGMGSPGIIDAARGISLSELTNIPGWKGMNIKKRLEDGLSLPAFVDNDVNVTALGEFKFGAGRFSKSMVCLTVGTGIGGGIVLDGKIWRGASFAAGEIGHVSVASEGPRCPCGNYGCVELFASGKAITEKAKEYLRRGVQSKLLELTDDIEQVDTRLIARAAKRGDHLSRQLIEEAGKYIGVALAGVLNLLNPQRIVIGGGVAQAGAIFFEAIDRELRRRTLPPAYEATRVVPACLGPDAGVIGAAALARQEFKASSSSESASPLP